MGVVNVTPDSFSDGGRFADARAAIDHGLELASAGAAILDIGGESTRPGAPAAVGKVIGPSFARAQIPDVIEKLIEVYLERREDQEERFIDVVRRTGLEPFKERVYGDHHQGKKARDRSLAAA